MHDLIDLFVRIAGSTWAYIVSDIPDNPVAQYMGFGFVCVGVLIVVAFLMSLFPLLFRSITAIFRRHL